MAKYRGKKVLVVGFGVSGVAVTHYMAKQGAKVTVTDMKQSGELNQSIKECQELKVEYDLGKHTPLHFSSTELVVLSPGVSLGMPILDESRKANIPITNEVDLAASALEQPLIVIGGTNGKTTVGLLLADMMKASGKRTFVAGHGGKSLLHYVNSGEAADLVIAELSSQQLDLAEKVVPATAIFTNLGNEKMDRYPSLEAYIASQKKLLKFCERNTYVVLNYDDPLIRAMGEECSGKVIWYTKQDPMAVGGTFAEHFMGAYLVPGENKIVAKVVGREEIYDLSKLKLFGDHNKENVLAAICAARVNGATPEQIQKVLNEFPGVPHRLEFLKKRGGVFFVNDSKSTSVPSLGRSLTAFKKNPIILIAGGKDKNDEFAPLQDLVKGRCKMLILMGEAKEKINRAIGDFAETYLVGTFEEAILLAYQKSQTGDIILLSPGCPSTDMFRNYEERGDYYKKLVASL